MFHKGLRVSKRLVEHTASSEMAQPCPCGIQAAKEHRKGVDTVQRSTSKQQRQGNGFDLGPECQRLAQQLQSKALSTSSELPDCSLKLTAF